MSATQQTVGASSEAEFHRTPDKSPAITLLRWLGRLLPGDRLRTAVFLHAVVLPRRILRTLLGGFYRMEHVYAVLREARALHGGRLSVLEFGTNEGYSFVKILYATKYLKLDDRVTVHGFDTFEGMPRTDDPSDRNIISGREEWIAGQFSGGHERLSRLCAGKYRNFRLHKGRFADTLTPELLRTLHEEPPILVWIDCDYYTSTREVLSRLLPVLRNGCVIYFDEFEFNYGSRFTGEARIVHEINSGAFGRDVELVLDRTLALDHRRVWRFVRFPPTLLYEPLRPAARDTGRSPTNHSPLP
jgi:hypothetical protein